MKPLVTFADPEALVVNYLTTAFAPRAEPYKPSTITVAFPTAALAGNVTHVQVELEVGGVADYPVTERAQVRVTCYAAPGKRTNVKALASLAQGLLSRYADANVANVTPLVGRSDVITDPTTKNLMVWFTVRVDLKATVLAS